ncbi:hypothetical protein [Mycobacterium sp.]|uniref:hypothetical protein n=1 Tax=Mycobacterium sp. TaxID=1785 RepID=UPI0025DAB1C2|nr:hypothetical protein [Mycobacterium sp.]
MTRSEDFDLSEAIELYLKRYPGSNQEEFVKYYGQASSDALAQVKELLREAMQIEPDWSRLSLNEAGDFVESTLRDRHPALTAKALESVGNYYTFLMR